MAKAELVEVMEPIHEVFLDLTMEEAESLLAVLSHVYLGQTGHPNNIANILEALCDIAELPINCGLLRHRGEDGLEFINAF